MRTRLLTGLLAALLTLPLAGCQSGDAVRNQSALAEMESRGWTLHGTEAHAALPPGTEIVTWVRGRGPDRERASTLRVQGEDTAIGDVHELATHTLALVDGNAAPAFARLAHRLGTPGVPAAGQVIEPDASLTTSGGSGRFGTADAEFWGIDFDVAPRPYAGGFVVDVLLLTPPVRNDELNYISPWRLVRVREVVYPDGTLQALDTKTVTNGDDAARFARY